MWKNIGKHTKLFSAGTDGRAVPARLKQLKEAKQHEPGTHGAGETDMEIHELVIEMKLLERRLTLYEEKYGVLSEDFYSALMSGKLARYDDYDETRVDFSRWKGIYETWLRRKQVYTTQLQQCDLAETLRYQPAY